MTVLLALASSLMWGVSDFFGGKCSRGGSTLSIVLVSQTTGLLVAVAVALGSGTFSDPRGALAWGVGAGLSGCGAVLMFYRALAIGTMSVVAPLAALGVVIPVVIGLAGGHLPSVLTLLGIVVAVIGVVAAARTNGSGRLGPGHPRSIVLALGAAVGFGLLQYAISGGSRSSPAMTMVVMRATSVPLLAVVALLRLRSPGSPAAVGRLDLRLVAVVATIGVSDVCANFLFALATVSGALAVVSVLGSLYPAVTVLLARLVDHEQLSRTQRTGVLTALVGVVLIAGGSTS